MTPPRGPRSQPGHLAEGAGELTCRRRPGHGPGVTSGEDVDILIGGNLDQVVPQVDGSVLLASQLPLGDEMRERPITVRRARDEDEMVGLGEIQRLLAVRTHAPAPAETTLATLLPGGTPTVPLLGGGHRVDRALRVRLQPDLHAVGDGKTHLS